MDFIIIHELEVSYRVGVSEQERSSPQKLHLNIEMGCNVSDAAAHDDLSRTIDYHAVCQRLLHFGESRSWKLLETLATDIAGMLRDEFRAQSATVEIHKFIIPGTRYVGVRLVRP